MTAITLEHAGPWTEGDYFALGETRQRIELVDGGLLVSPAPTFLHQEVAHGLAHAVKVAAPRGWLVIGAGNVRVAPSRILIPDVLVTDMPPETLVAPASRVPLVADVVSPSSMAQDRTLKPQLYAAAGTPWYLRVELSTKEGKPELVLHRLVGDTYTEDAHAAGQETLTLAEPFHATIVPETLLPS